jgi:hypothetical protein
MVEIPNVLIKMSVEGAENHPKRKTQKKRFLVFFLHARYRGSRSTKTEKTKKKQAEAENNELKTNTELHPVNFACLAGHGRGAMRSDMASSCLAVVVVIAMSEQGAAWGVHLAFVRSSRVAGPWVFEVQFRGVERVCEEVNT